jgi:Arc/MetJ-type ribon-helix-helix transcriptional regulator
MPEPRVTIKIPRPVYERVQGVVDDSGFRSATDFIVYVLREVLSERGLRHEAAGNGAGDGPLLPAEIEAIRKRLRALGYLE